MNQEVEVLLVEDNASDAEMTIRVLKKNNLASRLLHVKDGAEALEYLFSEGAYAGNTAIHPRVIFLDLKIPKVNGKEVLLRIKTDERTRKIPVVVLTSSREDTDIKECYELGVNGYVVKPLVFDDFYKAISDSGLYWLGLNQPPRHE